jgi:hypothetical protein
MQFKNNHNTQFEFKAKIVNFELLKRFYAKICLIV